MGLRVVKRKQWGARPAKDASPQVLHTTSPLYIHYSAGQGRGIDTKAEQEATMRAIQRMHQDDRGWSDVGYSYVLFQPYGRLKLARLFEGRTFANVPAAQEGANTGTGAICVVAAPGEKLKWQSRRLLRKAYRRFPGYALRGHRDAPGAATACPGDAIYSKLGTIRRARRKVTPRLP